MKDQEPPAPPNLPPKITLHRSEKIGIPILFLLPFLALLGVFGPRKETVEARSGTVNWSAEYPSRLRFENSDRLLVRIRNGGRASVSRIKLSLDPAYVHAFAPVTFDPAPENPYLVTVENLEPGESRLVAVQLTADEYGLHRGWMSLSVDGAETRTELTTFILP